MGGEDEGNGGVDGRVLDRLYAMIEGRRGADPASSANRALASVCATRRATLPRRLLGGCRRQRMRSHGVKVSSSVSTTRSMRPGRPLPTSCSSAATQSTRSLGADARAAAYTASECR